MLELEGFWILVFGSEPVWADGEIGLWVFLVGFFFLILNA